MSGAVYGATCGNNCSLKGQWLQYPQEQRSEQLVERLGRLGVHYGIKTPNVRYWLVGEDSGSTNHNFGYRDGSSGSH